MDWIDPQMNKDFPMACIGNIVTEYKGKKVRGDNTAFLISQDLVLTTLTSIYCVDFDDFEPNNKDLSITFYPSWNGKKKGFEVANFCYNREMIGLKQKVS